LALAFTVLGLQAARNLALSSIVLGVVAARYLPGALSAARPANDRPVRTNAQASPMLGGFGLIVAIGGLAIVAAAGFPRSDRPVDIVDKKYPIGSLEALDGRQGVRVFAFDFWAGYLIDQSWPGLRVYHDTRVDVYGEFQTIRYARAIAALPGWQETLDAACTTHVLVRPLRDPLSEVLRQSEDWRIEREEPRAVTFARRGPAPGCTAHSIG
jgi:hypothetical protein